MPVPTTFCNVDDAADAPHRDEPRGPEEAYASLLTAADRMLDEIDQALSRLADGTYGRCETCAQPIEDQRLIDQPTARTCLRHLPLAPED